VVIFEAANIEDMLESCKGFWVWGLGRRVQGSGCKVQGARFRVQGARFRGQGLEIGRREVLF